VSPVIYKLKTCYLLGSISTSLLHLVFVPPREKCCEFRRGAQAHFPNSGWKSSLVIFRLFIFKFTINSVCYD